MSATRVVQNAMYGVLSADSTLSALVAGGVHNDVPTGDVFPHVLMSGASETPAHTFGGSSSGLGWKNIVRLHVFSRYQGDTEALQIHDRIVALLNFQTLVVTGFSKVHVECESTRVMVEDKDKVETRHLVAEFCVVTRQ